MLEKTEHKRKGRRQRMRWLDSITNSMDINLRTVVKDRKAWSARVHEVARSQA